MQFIKVYFLDLMLILIVLKYYYGIEFDSILYPFSLFYNDHKYPPSTCWHIILELIDIDLLVNVLIRFKEMCFQFRNVSTLWVGGVEGSGGEETYDPCL